MFTFALPIVSSICGKTAMSLILCSDLSFLIFLQNCLVFFCEKLLIYLSALVLVGNRDEHRAGQDRTTIFFKIGVSGLDRTEKIFFRFHRFAEW